MGGALTRGLLGLCALVALALGPSAAAAGQPDAADAPPGARIERQLAEGERRFTELEYRAAIVALAALPADPAATRAQRLAALELIAISHLILGERVLAIAAFEDLLAIDPGYALQHDDGSPKIRSFFEAVRARSGGAARPEVALEHAVPVGAGAARPVELEVVVRRGVASVRALALRWRRRGLLAYQEAGLRRTAPDRYRGAFTPPASRVRYLVDYYVEAKNAAGGVVGRIGGPENPLALPIDAGRGEEPRPWYARWYVVAGGLVAVGAATTALVVLGSRDRTPDGDLEPGRITLSPD